MEKLKIYNKAIHLVALIYKFTRSNPRLVRDYSLCDQLRRASVSIAANIAEGYCRTKGQFKNYLSIVSGSANEVVALLQIITIVYHIPTEDLQEDFKVLGKQINAFSRQIK